MRGSWLILRAELARLLWSRSTWATGLVLAALSALRAMASVAAAAGPAGASVSSGRAWAPLADGWRAGLVLGVLVLLTFSARSIAGDRETGVLRLAITRSATRGAVLWGRLMLAPILIVAIVSVTGLAAGLVALRAGDYGPLVEDGYELLSASELREEFTRGLLASLPALWATFAFGLLISCMARSATGAVAGALGAFLAFDLFKDALGQARFFVFASYVPTLADSSPWAELTGVARGFSDAGFSDTLLRSAALMPGPEALAMAGLGVLILSRRSL
ncbi:MAG: hypothetical protein ACI8QZ_001410 [Chlamydiales bacterium]|jgi:hypothetical protein